jgi:putative glycosyltransferase (TIGR04348 family)
MKVVLVTPAAARSRSGNRRTAVRLARILEDLGHRVRVAETYDGTRADFMVAVHAWRSAESIDRFHGLHPAAPLVVVLAGTDIYRDQISHREATWRSMELATTLVGLHDLVGRSIPERFAEKLRVIHQSAEPLRGVRKPRMRHFDALVVGHLRPEKDPLRAAYAVRGIAGESRLRVVHYGKALDRAWRRAAEAEASRNTRYLWRGEVPRWRIRRALSTCRLLVLSSIMEGGANVVSEAIAADVPVIASDIEGSIGLLGADYAGYYRVEDTEDLRRGLLRAEADPDFLGLLTRQCRKRAPIFTPEHERAAWGRLLRASV